MTTPVKEVVVSTPLKPVMISNDSKAALIVFLQKLLANMKSNNYMINALTAMEAHDGGGNLGIQVGIMLKLWIS